jgi:hypothetical protein
MGLIRKAISASTLGGVKYTSRREAETKERLANARLAKAQAKQSAVGGDAPAAHAPAAAKWEPVVAAIEAGEASWDDLSRMQKLSMPTSYQVRCKAAERRRPALPPGRDDGLA